MNRAQKGQRAESPIYNLGDGTIARGSHHGKQRFQDEFRAFLQKYGVEFDERYVWD